MARLHTRLGRKSWRHSRTVAVGIGLLALMLTGVLIYIFHMPDETHSQPLPPLNAEESKIRDRLAIHIETLANAIGERNLWHYEALLAAADYIDHGLGEAGYQPIRESYRSRGKVVHNIVAERQGVTNPQEIILVGAHYDTVFGSPGANDNGSGVAALLELARLLAEQNLPRTLRFVAFVNEEAPFANSQEMGSLVDARASKARGDNIQAMLSLETIGHYSDEPGSQHYPFPLSYFYPDTANFVGFVGNLDSRGLVRSALRSFRRHAPFPSQGAAVPAWIKGVGWSDHWSFWQVGYRAIMVTDTAFFRYAHYHTPEDTPDKIDYERTARVVGGLAQVIADLATNPGDAD